jgi:hypothetical protein
LRAFAVGKNDEAAKSSDDFVVIGGPTGGMAGAIARSRVSL